MTRTLFALLCFWSATAFAVGGYYPFGDLHWKPPVRSAAQLPTSGNLTGDVRLELTTFTEYYWNGSAWVLFSSGTVTSVGMTVPTGLSVSGSPITGAGTFALSWSGTIPATSMPALTSDVTSSTGATATTVSKIQGTTVSGTTGSGNVVFSASPTTTGTLTGAAANFSSDTSTLGRMAVLTSIFSTGSAFVINGTAPSSITAPSQNGFSVAFTGNASEITIHGIVSKVTTGGVTTSAYAYGTQAPSAAGGAITSYSDFSSLGAAGHVATNNAAFSDTATPSGNSFIYQAGTDPSTLGGALAVGGTITPSSGIVGTATNNNATAGNVGEYIESVISSPTAAPTSGQLGDCTSISLTAGDWEVTGIVTAIPNGATLSGDALIGISTTSGNSATGLVDGSNEVHYAAASTVSRSATIPSYRVSLSGTTTYYLKMQLTYTVATPNFQGRLSARRMR